MTGRQKILLRDIHIVIKEQFQGHRFQDVHSLLDIKSKWAVYFFIFLFIYIFYYIDWSLLSLVKTTKIILGKCASKHQGYSTANSWGLKCSVFLKYRHKQYVCSFTGKKILHLLTFSFSMYYRSVVIYNFDNMTTEHH